MKIIRFTYQMVTSLDDLNVGSFFIKNDEISLYIHEGIFSFDKNKIVYIDSSIEPLLILHPQVNLILKISNKSNSSIKNHTVKPGFDVSQISVWNYKGEKQYSIRLINEDFLKVIPFLL